MDPTRRAVTRRPHRRRVGWADDRLGPSAMPTPWLRRPRANARCATPR